MHDPLITGTAIELCWTALSYHNLGTIGVNVGKYCNTIEHMGKQRFSDIGVCLESSGGCFILRPTAPELRRRLDCNIHLGICLMQGAQDLLSILRQYIYSIFHKPLDTFWDCMLEVLPGWILQAPLGHLMACRCSSYSTPGICMSLGVASVNLPLPGWSLRLTPTPALFGSHGLWSSDALVFSLGHWECSTVSSVKTIGSHSSQYNYT